MTGSGEGEDEAWLRRMRRCLQVNEQWEKRTGEAEMPRPGSRLAKDDERNPTMRPSTVAWGSIGSAVDHIGFAGDALQRQGGANLRPAAFYTVCRGALVAASQAIWVMTGSQKERLRRVQLLELEEAKSIREFYRDYANDESFEDDTSHEMAGNVRENWTKHAARERELHALVKPQRGEGSVTATMKAAAEYVTSQRDDPWVRRAFMFEWRSASGDAHARLWQRSIRPGHQIPLIGEGASIHYVTASPQSYGQSLAVATLATSEAFRLWDEHCGLSVAEPDVSGVFPG